MWWEVSKPVSLALGWDPYPVYERGCYHSLDITNQLTSVHDGVWEGDDVGEEECELAADQIQQRVGNDNRAELGSQVSLF